MSDTWTPELLGRVLPFCDSDTLIGFVCSGRLVAAEATKVLYALTRRLLQEELRLHLCPPRRRAYGLSSLSWI